MKTVYLYNTAENFRFDREYLCLKTKQLSCIGELTVPLDTKYVSFAHIINQSKDLAGRYVVTNEILEVDKKSFLDEKIPGVIDDNNAYYQRRYGKLKKEGEDEIIECKVEETTNRCDSALISRIVPLKYCCVGGQPHFYNFVENLTITDIVLTYGELDRRLTSQFTGYFDVDIMSIKISVDPYNSMRGHNCNKTIEEMYFKDYNIAINTAQNNLNILFNPLHRYFHAKSGTQCSQKAPTKTRSERIEGARAVKLFNLFSTYAKHQIAIEALNEEE